MKKHYIIAASLACISLFSQAQNPANFFEKVSYRGAFGEGSAADWSKPWSNFAPNQIAYPGDASYTGAAKTPVTVSTDITTDANWTNDNVYLLEGPVHVTNGATLTIQKGTFIRGKNTTILIGALIISKGAKIMAEGTATEPIVFTSEKGVGNRTRGDWAGIMLCGKATINAPLTNPDKSGRPFEALATDRLADYSTPNPDDNDNSGVMKYVRIEYAGYPYASNQELNSLTLAAVGRGTTLEYIQCSFGQDDSFEWFGGTVNVKHLIAFAGTDDEFDMDEGYRGFGQFLLGVRHPRIFETASNGQSNGLEHDNNTNLGSTTATAVVVGNNNPTPVTMPILSNVTLVGPLLSGTTTATTGALDPDGAARFNNAMELRTSEATNLFNSIAFGYPRTLILNNRANLSPSTANKADTDSLVVRNTSLANATGSFFAANSLPTGFAFTVATWFANGPSSGWGATAGATNNETNTSSDAYGLAKPGFELVGAATVAGANVNQVSFANTDFTLKADAPASVKLGACFAHPRVGALDAANCVLPTGLSYEETLSADKIVIFPNPANDNLQVALNSEFANATVTVQNSMGMTVASSKAFGESVKFDVSGFANGLYIVSVTNGSNSISKTLLINR